MAFFFYVAYALVIFLALAVAGAIPGCALRLLLPPAERWLLVPAVALGLSGWIWAGWVGNPYGISRLGLVLFAAVGAAGFVRGWLFGVEVAGRARKRPASG